MSQSKVREIRHRLHAAQERVTNEVLDNVDHEKLGWVATDEFKVNDVLRFWVHELRSHHRELVLARGRLTGDNPHFHVPHYVREANEEFGRFMGELACFSDDQLDLRVPEGGRSVREIAQHVLVVLEKYFGETLRNAKPPE